MPIEIEKVTVVGAIFFQKVKRVGKKKDLSARWPV